jgi:hypothetical protein
MGAIITMLASGHPTEDPLTAALLVIHLGAAALWLGAAPAILLTIQDRATTDDDALRVVRRFSRVTTVTLFVVIGAGSLLAYLLTDPFVEGLDPRYIAVLATKVALVGLAALLGALSRRRLATDQATRAALRRLFAIDSLIVLLVVALSTALTVGPPRPACAAEDDIHVGHCTLETDAGFASLSLVPARVGENAIYLDGAGALEGARVEFRLPGDAGAIEVELGPNGEGWSGTVSVPVAGVWEVTTVASLDMFTEDRWPCDLRIEP